MRDLSNPLLGGAFAELLYIVVGLLVALDALYSLLTSSERIHIIGVVAGLFMAALGADRLTAKRRFRRRHDLPGPNPHQP